MGLFFITIYEPHKFALAVDAYKLTSTVVEGFALMAVDGRGREIRLKMMRERETNINIKLAI